MKIGEMGVGRWLGSMSGACNVDIAGNLRATENAPFLVDVREAINHVKLGEVIASLS